MVKETRDIEKLVEWALIDNGLGSWFGVGEAPAGWQELGTRIASSRWAISLPRVSHPDALTIFAAIHELTPDAAALVVQHGRIGDAPDWCEEGVGEWRQRVDGRGRLMWEWEHPKTRSGKRIPLREFVGETAERVRWYRAKYTLWHVALTTLTSALRGRLDRYEPTGPARPAEPWMLPRMHRPDGSVITGLRGEGTATRRAALRSRGPLRESREAALANAHSSGSAEH